MGELRHGPRRDSRLGGPAERNDAFARQITSGNMVQEEARSAMHSLAYRIFSFSLFTAVAGGFVALGLLIAFWPASYERWVRWSTKSHPPWLALLLRVDYNYRSWRYRMLGIWFALFGVTFIILGVRVYWFQ